MKSGASSRVFHEPRGDDRNRDIFPLPLLHIEGMPRGNMCRAVTKRLARRRAIGTMTNKTIHALNSLFFGESFSSGVPCTSMSSLPLNQKLAIQDIMGSIRSLGSRPAGASGPEALQALRAAASCYSEPDVGIGDVVPLALQQLSLPDGVGSGVDLCGALDPAIRSVVDDFENTMLQDSDVWTSISSEARKLQPYDDPSLKSRPQYLSFIRELCDRGILGITDNCRGRVGAFSVAKKPKIIDGKVTPRQRLVLDCRQTNMMFRASPHTQLGSLSALCDLEIDEHQQLHVAGADIRDCFYAVRLPHGLEQFFVLRSDLTRDEAIWVTRGNQAFAEEQSRFCPAIVVLPMGFSWSFYLVQNIHESAVLRALNIPRDSLILEGHPIPTVDQDAILSLPYCDNVHILGVSSYRCTHAKDEVCDELRHLGFQLHEEEDANTLFHTLGGTLDGAAGEVRPTALRAWRIMAAFEHVIGHPVSGRTVQKLLGHAMFICVLNRAGMSVFRSLYDFVQRNIDDLDRLRMLNHREVLECKIFVGLVPLLFASLRRQWSTTVICSDASPQGFGICEREADIKSVRNLGRWHERWRFKRLEPSEWNPRRRAMGADVTADVHTILGTDEEERILEQYVDNHDFPEIPSSFMQPGKWKTCLMGKWGRRGEHITLKEGRSLVLAFRRLCRSSHNRHKRHLVLVDNLSLAFCANKGRAHSYSMLRITQQLAALQLAGSFSYRVRWIPSELNVADGPSRGSIQAGALGLKSKASVNQFSESFACEEESDEAVEPESSTGQTVRKSSCVEEAQFEGGEQSTWSSTEDSGSSEEHSATPPGSGGECGPKSPDRRHDHSGNEIGELRSPVTISEVLPDIREFLPNLRSKLAPRRRLRFVAGRSSRCALRGRKELQRRREDCSFSRVLQHPAQRKALQKPSCPEGLEEREASAKPLADPFNPCSRDVDGVGSQRRAANGLEALGGSRLLPSTWREHRAQGKGRGASGVRSWKAVSVLPFGHQRFRNGGAGQSRCIRQLHPSQQSQEGILGGDVACASPKAALCGEASLPVHLRSVSSEVPRSRRHSGPSRVAPIPVASRGSCRRREQWRQRLCPGQAKGAVAHRSECAPLHEGREDPAVVEQAVSNKLAILSMVEKSHGGSPQGIAYSQDALTKLGWVNVLKLKRKPKRFSLELFAGTARIASAINALGRACFPIDICIDPSHNLLDINVEHHILHLLDSGCVDFIWLGMPCTSFSIARKWDGLGPGPLRDVNNLHGFPWLRGADLAKVRMGNSLLRVSLRILSRCEQLQIPYALENPRSSFAWQMPELCKFTQLYSPTYVNLDYCQYGEPWKKPTTIIGNFWNLHPLKKLCGSYNNVCTASSKPHVRLTGVDENNVFMTLWAQPYPRAFAALVASLLANAND